tara:strand:+ start:713 stop:1159 length:447 start_codon:yes stop_codon:yes gene_type:complete
MKTSKDSLRVAMVVSRYNCEYTDRLLDGAYRALRDEGLNTDLVNVIRVPGAFEIPVAAAKLANSGGYDTVICLGAVIRSDTPHFDYVAGEAARGIMQAGLDSGVPIIFGVMTLNTIEQAEVRTRNDRSNRGYEAAKAGIEMACTINDI